MGLLWQKEDRYLLDKIGHFLVLDDMAKVNLNFVHDVCYQGMFELESSLLEGKPNGLKVFGDWETIYPTLSELPHQVSKAGSNLIITIQIMHSVNYCHLFFRPNPSISSTLVVTQANGHLHAQPMILTSISPSWICRANLQSPLPMPKRKA